MLSPVFISWAVPPLSFPSTRLEQCFKTWATKWVGACSSHPHIPAILHDNDEKVGGREEEGRGEPLLPGVALVPSILIAQTLTAPVNYNSQRIQLAFHLQRQL